LARQWQTSAERQQIQIDLLEQDRGLVAARLDVRRLSFWSEIWMLSARSRRPDRVSQTARCARKD